MIDQSPSILSAEQLRELSQRGFLVVHDFINESMIRQLIAVVESLEPDANSSRVRRGVMFARRNLLELDFVRELIELPRVRDILDAIVPGLMAVRAILFDKTGSANWTVPWHQDRSIAVQERIEVAGFGPWSKKAGILHVQPPLQVLQRMITLRIHLDPCGFDNGPLRVIAGKHHCILDQTDIENCISNLEQVSCTTSAGGLILMRPLVPHASSPATNPSHRRVIHIEFGSKSLPGGLRWATDWNQ